MSCEISYNTRTASKQNAFASLPHNFGNRGITKCNLHNLMLCLYWQIAEKDLLFLSCTYVHPCVIVYQQFVNMILYKLLVAVRDKDELIRFKITSLRERLFSSNGCILNNCDHISI